MLHVNKVFENDEENILTYGLSLSFHVPPI